MKYVNNEQSEEIMLNKLSKMAEESGYIKPELYRKYEVKRGLRDLDGKGVLVGLTEIGEVHSYIMDEGEKVSVPGRLIYRGIDIRDIVKGFTKEDRYGFEETAYLLLFGTLPDLKAQKEFEELLSVYQRLPEDFARDVILKAPSKDIMNTLARSVLALYSFDDNPDDTSMQNVLKQCLRLIACFPSLAVYGYQAFSHYHGNQSLYIHSPRADLSIAENILAMLRPDSSYTALEAKLLDLALVLHAEHGGGNNSSFVTHVVTSTGTDTYSAMAAAIGALKGPRHGGANIKVVQMFEDMKDKLKDWEDDEEIEQYLTRILSKDAFDRSGLIYGIGHAVYSISDPRAVILKHYVSQLAQEKGLVDEFNLYAKVETLAPQVIEKVNTMYKTVSANVDFYSGFVYKMLNIPMEMFTPIFAISRIVGWSAHRIEEIANSGKIIRPAYKSVAPRRKYIRMNERS
ncbi:citrate/2-methylcitrate synthase [Desulfosporosinus sp.]|uniref:citrate/2-methylcitrate synthase n=1 Tax=Desulfosporosinus sp. TaxID=157907 RepID=UPI000E8DB79C|nr:citrate/2-methylcitrate synthase [Desulfosporosinus sp.]MBC2723674.1 citrate/2-methylcitrate synthase [Desulfosporosinus sp.]MBC2726526.1 citrate/2-methylcitrate synthase [Desulfosporosinus sp.]HBV87442.1 citrate synthase [Desulfosporosinus sp.]